MKCDPEQQQIQKNPGICAADTISIVNLQNQGPRQRVERCRTKRRKSTRRSEKEILPRRLIIETVCLENHEVVSALTNSQSGIPFGSAKGIIQVQRKSRISCSEKES